MKSIINHIGFKEVIIVDNCDFDIFYICAKNLKMLLNIGYINQVDDFDSLYWQFNFNESAFIIHYNVFLGIGIHPKKGKNSSSKDNEALDEIFELIKDKDMLSKNLFK